MMPVQPGETLVGTAIGHNGRELGQIQGKNVKAMMAELDAKWPNAHAACITGEFTSDGTRWKIGMGRVLASREPRTLDDGRFYKGWIVE